MHELEGVIRAGWEKIREMVEGDREELGRRLARRRSVEFLRWPRGWCLGVRASDRRITPWSAAIVPEQAVKRRWKQAHWVTITSELVRWLTRPVYATRPYSEKLVLARELGVSQQRLDWAIKTGVFSVRKISGLGGKRGSGTAVVETGGQQLDPGSGSCFRSAHWVWGTQWRFLSEHVPDGIEQRVRRVPAFIHAGRRGWGGHAELSVRHCGYRWVCPGCRKKVKILFYPLAHLHRVELLDREVEEVDAWPKSSGTFACGECHRVKYFSTARVEKAWNEIVMRLSGGLLYGHEVERPGEFARSRKREYRPMAMRRPSKRRAEVLERLLLGMRCGAIARDLGIASGTVTRHMSEVYRQERVHSQEALCRKYGGVEPERRASPRRDQVARLLLEGYRYEDIGRMIGKSKGFVGAYAWIVYKFYGVHSRMELGRKLGVHVVKKLPRRERVRRLVEEGLSVAGITRRLGITYQGAWRQVREVKREGVGV